MERLLVAIQRWRSAPPSRGLHQSTGCAAHGARRITLVSRSGQTPEVTERLRSLPGGTEIDVAPESYDGVGVDEAPRSPVWRVNKRHSWRSPNGTPKKESFGSLPNGKKEAQTKDKAEEGELVYENVYNKSGENLATLAPPDGYYTSLAQRANKQATTEPPANVDGRQRRNSENKSRQKIRCSESDVFLHQSGWDLGERSDIHHPTRNFSVSLRVDRNLPTQMGDLDRCGFPRTSNIH